MIAYSKEELLILGGFSAGGTKVDNKYERSIYKLKCFSGTVYRLASNTSDFGLISAPDILERDILAQTFHHGDVLGQGHYGTRTFWHGYISAPWTLWHKDVTALGHFGTWMFQHIYILASC